ncbi:MAG: MOSC domain-containing protein [Anderseniella sp.]|jgi:uncharacterized protein YcbX|nr:MOSC domain-containing protein [Anderseniella sp.]
MTSAISITAINTFPVKGLSACPHQAVSIKSGAMLPFDRAWAIETGARKFNPAQPAWLPKISFAQLMSHEKLAQLETSYEASDGGAVLTILRDGKQVARGNLATQIGRQLIEQFIAGFMATELRGSPKIVHADGHHFADVPARFISLLNLASVREVARVAGKPIDPRRFRANIHIDGAEPWEEFKWLGRNMCAGGKPLFRVAERITRCAATSVNPDTSVRDVNLPRLLASAFTHEDCGVYVSAIADMELETGQAITIA